MTRPALTDFFNTTTGLERCVSDLCNAAAVKQNLVLYWHIAPTGLSAGTYRSNITYFINTFGS